MENYYFNNHVDEHNFHEVHRESCVYLPAPQNRTYIGSFGNCKSAIAEAKRQHPSMIFDGCYYCCRECHKG